MGKRLTQVRRDEIAATLLVCAAAFLVVLNRNAPLIPPDELGFLANAQLIAGKGVFDMLDTPYYPFGYSLLVTPGYLLFDDPQWIYRFALFVNVVLAALTVPLSTRLLVCFGYGSGRIQLLCCVLVALWPSYAGQLSLAWAETTFRFIFLVFLLTAARAIDTNKSVWFAAMAIATAGLWATHARALALLPLVAGFFVLSAAITKGRRSALTGLAVLVGAAAIVGLGHKYFQSHVWDSVRSSAAITGDMLDGALSMEGAFRILMLAIGQSWYQIAASFGLSVVGVLALSRLAIKAKMPTDRWLAFFTGLSVLAVMGASVMQMTSPPPVRPDHLAYGRYLDAAAAPVVLLGMVSVGLGWVRKKELLLAAALVMASGIGVYLYALSRTYTYFGYVTVPGIAWMHEIAAQLISQPFAALFIGVSVLAAAGSVMLAIAVASPRTCLALLFLYAAFSGVALQNWFSRAQAGVLHRVTMDSELFQLAGAGDIYWPMSSWIDPRIFLHRFISVKETVIPLRDDAIAPDGALVLIGRQDKLPGGICLGEAGSISMLWRKVAPNGARSFPSRQVVHMGERFGWLGCHLGWSQVEHWGRWTEGRSATLSIAIPLHEFEEPVLQMDVAGLVGDTEVHQRVIVHVNGQDVAQWNLSANRRVVEVPLPRHGAMLQFTLPDAASPAELGISGDKRILAMSVTRMCLTAKGEKCL